MRLKIDTETFQKRITCNYNYSFSSAIYKFLQIGSPEFAEFLHNKGFHHLHKNYKLFTFAVVFEKFRFSGNEIELLSPKVTIFISTPLIGDFIKNFVIGAFTQSSFQITSHYSTLDFKIEQIESLPDINFSDSMKFKCLSPIVLSTGKEYNNKMSQYFLRPEDKDEIDRVLFINLTAKYKIINDLHYTGDKLHLEWDWDYINKKKRVSAKVTINENANNSVDIIGIRAPFTLTGDPELIKIGYDTGFGEKNSMGFGFAESVNNN